MNKRGSGQGPAEACLNMIMELQSSKKCLDVSEHLVYYHFMQEFFPRRYLLCMHNYFVCQINIWAKI